MRNGLRRILSTFLSLVLCLGLLPGSGTHAEPLPLALPTEAEAIDLLRFYQVVRGDENGDLHLDQTLTRAEAATIFVRSLGKESEVAEQTNLTQFTDTIGHWGAPWVAVAVRYNLMLGDGNGRFRPDETITYAEILTVLMRMTDQPLPTPWTPEAAFAAAQAIGIAPLGTQPTAPALRSKVFWALGSTISRIPLQTGKTLIQTYLDTIPPDLTVDESEIITRDPAITITGTSFEATTLTIDGKPLPRDKTGRFTYRATLKPGTTAFDLVASDKVGNSTKKQVIVTVLNPVSAINVTGPTTFAVGSENQLQITATDSMGQSVDSKELSYTISGDVATYDPVRQTLYAGNIPGKGTLTLKSGRISKAFVFTISGPSATGSQLTFTQINGGRALPTDKEVQVQVQVKDAAGKLQTTDNFRPITFNVEGLSGVTPAQQVVQTTSGVAVLTLKSTREGSAKITASANGLSPITTDVQFLSSPRIVLVPKVTSLAADGTATTTVKAQLQDENGKLINAPTGLAITLATSGAGATLLNSTLTIDLGKNTSGEVAIQAGIKPGQQTITGRVSAGPAYSVQSTSIELSNKIAGAQILISANGTGSPNIDLPLTIQVVDAQSQPIRTGSYAYQIKVESSQNDPIVGGLPEGVSLTIAGTSYSPIDDGKPASDTNNNPNAVIGRTTNGKADLILNYAKSGRLKLSVQLLPATEEAYDSTDHGPAVGTTGFGALPIEIVFQGAANAIRLTATSNLGTGITAATTAPNRTITVRAEVVDLNGFVLTTQTPVITLTKGAGMSISAPVGATSKRAVAGVAEFQVQTTAVYGFDVYTATVDSIPPGSVAAGSITVASRKDRSLNPQVDEIRGYPSGTLGTILPDDTHLEIRLFRQDAQFKPQGEPTNWVVAKVFRKGETGALVSNVAVDMLSSAPKILVPRERLRTGTATYEVVLNNGVGDSARSVDLGLSTAVTQTPSTSYRISSASYDAATGKLVLTSSGIAATGSVDVTKLSLMATESGNSLTLDPSQVGQPILTANTITINLGALDPDRFYGLVKVTAADGWYDAGPAGSIAKATEYTAGLKPMARISHTAVDLTGKFLYLYGTGFTQGTLDLSKLYLKKSADPTGTRLPGAALDRVISRTDTEVKIALSPASLLTLTGLTGSDLVIGADVGWLWSGTSTARYNAAALPTTLAGGTDRRLHAWVQITAVSYTRSATAGTLTLTGKNFAGATVNLANLAFKAYGASAVIWPTGPVVTLPVSAISDSRGDRVEIVLDPADAASFESKYAGRQLYLHSAVGGDWLLDANGRAGMPLPANSLLLSVRSN